ncbi:MAG: isoprenyl transferase [Deltaproteobacteria bacterium]|nr:isoprenyl transferase [Deltaproteobacteria bacterium]
MTLIDPNKIPKHVAIIMDGNGRWAKKRAINRLDGHKKGADAVREIVEASREIGVSWLTLYAFSEENWKRPKREINALMALLKRFLKSELDRMVKNGIRLQSIGRIEKLPKSTRDVLLKTIEETSANKGMVLTLALSYGGRQEIVDAVRRIVVSCDREKTSPDEISEQLVSGFLYTGGMPDPDLLIRTSGEYRVSNFLLWQIAYTEFYITPTLWPDFGKNEYLTAILDFQKRERRFGGREKCI